MGAAWRGLGGLGVGSGAGVVSGGSYAMSKPASIPESIAGRDLLLGLDKGGSTESVG